MKRRFSNRKSKKGLMSLEALVGILLSVAAMLALITLFVSLFLNTPTNLEIAKDNARSIIDFVEFSKENYGHKEECYTLLKLKNLDNYQIEEEDGNYFHVVDRRGVHILKIEVFDEILGGIDEGIINENSVKTYYFGQEEGGIGERFRKQKYEMNILMEELDLKAVTTDIITWAATGVGIVLAVYTSPTVIGTVLFTAAVVGVSVVNDVLNNYFYSDIELIGSKYIIIFPKFGKEFLDFDIPFVVDNQNILVAVNFERVDDENIIFKFIDSVRDEVYFNSHYLVYKPSKNIFPSYTSYAENTIKHKLCGLENYLLESSKRKFNSFDEYSRELNKYKVYDFDNRKIVFKPEPVCFLGKQQSECESDYFPFDEDRIKDTYGVEEIREYYIDKPEDEFFSDLLAPINVKIEGGDLRSYLWRFWEDDFEDKFPNNVLLYSEEITCEEKVFCKRLIYDESSGIAYFYDEDYLNNFARFENSYLFKEGQPDQEPETYDVFFNVDESGNLKKINFKRKLFYHAPRDIDSDDYGDDYGYFYVLSIPYSGKIRRVIISEKQWDSISSPDSGGILG